MKILIASDSHQKVKYGWTHSKKSILTWIYIYMLEILTTFQRMAGKS